MFYNYQGNILNCGNLHVNFTILVYSSKKKLLPYFIPFLDVDVDVVGVYERRPRPVCPPHLITLQFNYMLKFLI